MSFNNRSARNSSEPASWLTGIAGKALAILALAAAVYSISPFRIFAAQAGTLHVVNTNNNRPVVVEWVPMVNGGIWKRFPAVAARSQATFGISLPDGRPASTFTPTATTIPSKRRPSTAPITIMSLIRNGPAPLARERK